MNLYYDVLNSPIGKLYVIANDDYIVRVELTEECFEKFKSTENDITKGSVLCMEAIKQLEEYFLGKRKMFDLPLSFEDQGTSFQREVWKALLEIPYGEVKSYSDIALRVNNPAAVRAIGQANRANRLPIFIPCHRVIGKNGKLVGYAGTRTDIKEILLKLEGVL